MRLLFCALLSIYPIAAKAEISKYIASANGTLATVYGFSEKMCGDPGKARKCDRFAVTASGQQFDPQAPTAAISLPVRYRMPPEGIDVWMRLDEGECTKININDKKNYRFKKTRPLDLSVGAVRALGGDPHKSWGGKVFLCDPNIEQETSFISEIYTTTHHYAIELIDAIPLN
jgi:hypothetical protein